MAKKIILIDDEMNEFKDYFYENFDEKVDEIIKSKKIESFEFKAHLNKPKLEAWFVGQTNGKCEVEINLITPSQETFKNLITLALSKIS